jgi:hypothetical protein
MYVMYVLYYCLLATAVHVMMCSTKTYALLTRPTIAWLMCAHRYPTVVSNTIIVQSAVDMCRLAQIANSTHGTATKSYNCINIVSVSSLGQLTNARALENNIVSRVRARGAGGKPGHHWPVTY